MNDKRPLTPPKPKTQQREDNSIVLYIIIVSALFFIFILNNLGSSGDVPIDFHENKLDKRRKAMTSAVTSLQILNEALTEGWIPIGKEREEQFVLIQRIQKHLSIRSGFKTKPSTSFQQQFQSSFLRQQLLSSQTNQPTQKSDTLISLMHDAIKSALPRLMQLEIDLLALPSHPLERELSAASMSAALTQANQQIIEVTRYIEEISEKFAREQYDLLKIDDMNTDIKIQIGAAGDSSLMDWINIDILGGRAIRSLPGKPKEIALNVATTKLPFHDGSTSIIYLAHVLEHLEFPDSTFFLLHEAYRCLKPGGVIRIIVPDSKKWMAAYLEDSTGTTTPFWKAARKGWPEWDWDDEPVLPLLLSYLGALDNTLQSPNPHRVGFDFILISNILQQIGFVNIIESKHKKIDETSEAASNYYMENGKKIFFSLYVEATRR